jgi:hypothetical protein
MFSLRPLPHRILSSIRYSKDAAMIRQYPEERPMANIDDLNKSLTELQTRLDSLRGRL